jgi:excisionase family DNA binding protein
MTAAPKLALCKLQPEQFKQSREWLGLRELTEYADVSERTLRAWMHRETNPLPAVQVGSKILVKRAQFDIWLERHRILPISSVDVDSIVAELMGK